jgi:predicted transcriptional regulator
MAEKRAITRTITLTQEQGAFSAFFSRFRSQKAHESSDISMLRTMLSPEKARLLHVLRSKQPNSLYELAKILGRDFKAVRHDISILENFGMVEMIPIHKGKRKKLKPILVVDELKINIKI